MNRLSFKYKNSVLLAKIKEHKANSILLQDERN